MNFGLKEKELKYIKEVTTKFTEVEEVIIFGSRAMGNQKVSSDIDIAVKGKYIPHEIVLKIVDILNEDSPLPYFFDVINYNNIENPELKKHIDEKGITIYKKM
ncbi:MAG: nucleotidyltransferase family protein [Rhodothermaceae bacterium]